MKKTIILFIAVAFWGITGYSSGIAKGQNNSDSINVETVSKQYVEALKSSNTGLMESALFETVKLQMNLPEHEFNKLTKEVDRINRKAQSPRLQYKAYIVAQFLNHPEWFEDMGNIDELKAINRVEDDSEEDMLFVLLMKELQNHYLVLANNNLTD